MKWAIYYDSGIVRRGESTDDAFAVPVRGVQLIKQEAPSNPNGFSLRHGCNFFCWEQIRLSDGTYTDQWRWGGKGDVFGLMDYYAEQKGPQKVLIGREIHDQTFQDIHKQAIADGCLCDGPCKHRR